MSDYGITLIAQERKRMYREGATIEFDAIAHKNAQIPAKAIALIQKGDFARAGAMCAREIDRLNFGKHEVTGPVTTDES